MATTEIANWHEAEIQKSNEQAQAAEDVKQRALSMRVTDEQTQAKAADFARRIKEKAKTIADYWKPLKDSAFKAHRALTAREAELLKPLSEAEAHLKTQISRFQLEQERIRREEQRRLEAEAQRRAEEEREALLLQAEDAGATAEEVSAMAEMPLAVAPVVEVAVGAPKPGGVVIRRTWKAVVEDKSKLVTFVAANSSMLHLLVPDQSALNAMAKAMKSAGAIPGVKFYEEQGASIR